MNGYQRIKAALNGQWPDQRPTMLHNFMMAVKEAGISQKTFRRDPEKAARVFIQATEKYDLDGILIDFDTATLAGAAGVPVDLPENEPARTHGTAIQSLEEVEKLEDIDITQDERVQVWLETCRLVKKYFGDEKFVRGNCDQAPFSLASMIRGTQDWMLDLMGPEEPVMNLLRYATNITVRFINLVAATGVDMLSNGDSPAGPEMISPEMYRRFALPFEKTVVDEAHDTGLPYVLHICGNTDIILESMLESGTDGLELDYKTDIHKIHDLCAGERLFIGNIDPSGVIALGSAGEVKEKTLELLEIYKDSPRFIMNAGCAIPAETPEENIWALVRTTREFQI